MAAYTAKDVSELRQRTQAGMMDCKKALEECQGDMSQAVEWLRKKGISRGESRAGRAASEGKIVARTSPDGTIGAIVELNSETDFVARNEAFGQTVEKIADTLLAQSSSDGVVATAEGSPLMNAQFGEGGTLAESLKSLTGTIGENIVLRRYARFGGSGAVGSYVHHNGKVGTLVEIAGATGEAAQQLARTVAEHVTAGVPTIPVSVTRDDVPSELVDRERRIFTEQAAASGKPENIVKKMVDGRIDKFYKEITLLDQPWVRDDSKTIGDLVKAAGAGVSIRRFARFQIGQE
ncbi:MAG TPA: translation elongation factor Ts [Gemmatimonadaceae bacterium]|nr:translation elongation factor Ts [Gemmatimonadaceae bacterium]